MGNCLKSASSDDLTLLNGRAGDVRQDSVDEDRNILNENLQPIFYPTISGQSGSQQQISSEDEQIKAAKRIALIQHLPIHQFTKENFQLKKNSTECDICMNDFAIGDRIRYLPCMHQYHLECVDNWLMRSLTCPSCCEPIDAGLLSSYANI